MRNLQAGAGIAVSRLATFTVRARPLHHRCRCGFPRHRWGV